MLSDFYFLNTTYNLILCPTKLNKINPRQFDEHAANSINFGRRKALSKFTVYSSRTQTGNTLLQYCSSPHYFQDFEEPI